MSVATAVSAATFLLLFLLAPGDASAGASDGWSCVMDSTVAVVDTAGSQWNVQMASDGSNGAVAVWQDRRDGLTDKLYVQRISADGTPLWTPGGVALASTPGFQFYPQIAPDGDGGAWVVWQDNRDATGYDIYLQHVSPTGDMLLEENGLPLCKSPGHQYYPKIVPAGGGEVIVAWQDRRAGNFDIYAQKVNMLGNVLWTANGRMVCNTEFDQVDPVVAPDGAGGAIVAWSDFRGASGFTDIYAQRIRWNGAAAWTVNGVPISQAVNNQWNPQIVSDDRSGAIVAWQDRRNSFYDLVYLQRVDSGGARQWEQNGMPAAPVEGNQYYPRIAGDGAGGVIAVWQDIRGGADYDIYAQRVGPGGSPLWSETGEPVSTATGHQYYPQLVREGASVLVAWQDRRGSTFDIYSQRLDLGGVRRWKANGVPVTTAVNDQYLPQLAGDGREGAVVAWADFRRGRGSTDVFANRIGSNGLPGGGCFRTFTQDSLGLRGVRIRRTTTAMPNEGNIRDSIFGRGVFAHGMVIGDDRHDSAKRYGWIYYKKSYYLRRTLPQNGEARGFDRRFDRPFLGMLRNPSHFRYNNVMVGELVALKLNIAASEVGITPPFFGDLIFVDPLDPSNPFNGASIRDVAARADSMLTYWRSYPGLDYPAAANTLRRINRAFDGPMDTISLRPLRVTAVAPLFSLDYLVPNTDPPASVPEYVAVTGVPDEDAGYRLEQNYPNPFNPTTTIEFTLAAPSAVTLRIYDLTGRTVGSIFDAEPLDEGLHAVDFDGHDLSSGVYFYRILAVPAGDGAGPQSFVRKMVLLK